MAPGRIRDGVGLTNALAAGAPAAASSPPDAGQGASEPFTVGGVEFREIADDDVDHVVALWEACGLTRPWNDPHRDVADARTGPASTILVAHAADATAAADGGSDPGEPAGSADTTITPPGVPLPGAAPPGATPQAAAPVVATVMVGHDGHRGWMYYLAVAPDARGTGLGRDAVVAAEAWLVAQGVRKARLMVRTTNAEVLGFYERLGYEDAECTVLGRDLA
jgi:ribosomal protein S18 acetylase RimI-like enzyme